MKSRFRKNASHPATAAVAACPSLGRPASEHAEFCAAVIARCEALWGLVSASAPAKRAPGSSLAAGWLAESDDDAAQVLTRLAAAHQVYRAGDVASPPGVIYTPAALAMRLASALREAVDAVRAPAGTSAPVDPGALRVLDPAVGCGELLVAWLQAGGAAQNRAARRQQAATVHGWDLDPVAVSIARARVLCACVEPSNAGGSTGALIELRRRLQANIRVADGLSPAPELAAEPFDLVLANPPFQFLSGKASPVAALQRRDSAAARALAADLERIARNYPEASQGCRDLYKWFIAAVLRRTRVGGHIGLITPNTWLYLTHFRDVRRLLAALAQPLALWDLGFGAFAGATLGTAVLTARRVPAETGMPPTQVLRTEAGRDLRRTVQWRAGDYDIFRSARAKAVYQREDLTSLGALASIVEGEHGLHRAGLVCRRAAAPGFRVPAVADDRLQPLMPAVIEWWPAKALQAAATAAARARHSGPRLLLRKTGAGLVCTPAPEAFAWAHQNLYVLRPTPQANVDGGEQPLPAHWLALWLTAEPVQRLYREGPHGQPGRPMAQLRVAALARLPAPPAARWFEAAAQFEALWRSRPGLPADAVSGAASDTAAKQWRRRLNRLAEQLFRAAKSAECSAGRSGGRRSHSPRLTGPAPERSGALRAAGSAVH